MCALIVGLMAVLTTVLPEEVVSLLESSLDEDLMEQYEELAQKRMDFNSMGREELEDARLFTLFQIESLLEYRSRYGAILSRGELAAVDGFDARTAALCHFFFEFNPAGRSIADTASTRWSHLATVKTRTAFASENASPGQASVTAKYLVQAPSGWSFGLTADSDAGESLSEVRHPDFLSVFAHFRGGTSKIVKEAVAGDFTARFGQGLVLWKSFAFSELGNPSAAIRRGAGISPYKSTDEANFFRGAAVTLRLGDFEATALASYNALDARLAGSDGNAYTSIVTGGYHRTLSEIVARRTMHELVAGLSLRREFSRFRLGITAAAYTYDKANARKVQIYNQLQMYDGWFGNFGADIYAWWGKFRLAAEFALDARFRPAATASILWQPSYRFEMSLSARHYDKGYTATHAGAYSTLSSCSNQTGLTLVSVLRPNSFWSISWCTGYSFHPWPRYLIPGGSKTLKTRIEARRNVNDLSFIRAQVCFDADFEGSLKEEFSPSAFLHADLAAGQRLVFQGRVAVKAVWEGIPGANFPAPSAGIAGYLGIKCSFLKSRLSVSARMTACSTDDYSSRIYFYEGGVPQSFGITAYWGRTLSGYLLATWKLPRQTLPIEFHLRVSSRDAAFFVKYHLR